MRLLLLLAIPFFAAPARASEAVPNWLADPGFESPGSRAWSVTAVWPEGHASQHSLHLANTEPRWQVARQRVLFNDGAPSTATLAAWMRTHGVVRGAQEWEDARVTLDFKDAQGAQVGGYQASVASVDGDHGWERYEGRFNVPAGAVAVDVELGLGNCRGEAWFDDVDLGLEDRDGRALTTVPVEAVHSDTRDWWPVRPPRRADGTALDLSFLNAGDRPAGRHGFIGVKGGHFTAADGTRMRFWGSNLVGPNNFPDKAAADALSRRVAKLGMNLMRLHMPDAAWSDRNLFINGAPDTLSLDPVRLDQLDYLVAALKREGVYVYVDWMVARRFRAGDGVKDYAGLDDGAKGAVQFDPRIMELDRLYACQLLGHVNPYLGHPLADDPCYLASEVVNESSLFTGFGAPTLPESYRQALEARFHAAGGQGPLTWFQWNFDQERLDAVRAPENAAASRRFLQGINIETARTMKAFQAGLSGHGLLTGSNMGLPLLPDLRADASLDFMDTHAYWDHPQVWNIPGGWADVAHAPYEDRAQLRAPFKGSLLYALSQAAVLGKPLIVTEWNDCFPNQYRIEGPLLMAAYGSLQDWDGLLQFDYAQGLPGGVPLSPFGIQSRPDNEPLFQAGALIYRAGLLKASPLTVVEGLSDAQVMGDGGVSAWLPQHPWLPYVAKVAKRFTGLKATVPPSLQGVEAFNHASQRIVDSCTGQLHLDWGRGLLRLDSPQAQGFVGALAGPQALTCSALRVQVSTRQPWAAVVAVSLQGQPLARSQRSLLVAVAACENQGQTYAPSHTVLRELGGLPVLMQGVSATVRLAVEQGLYQVHPLDADGDTLPPLAVRAVAPGWVEFSLRPSDHSATYIVARTP